MSEEPLFDIEAREPLRARETVRYVPMWGGELLCTVVSVKEDMVKLRVIGDPPDAAFEASVGRVTR